MGSPYERVTAALAARGSKQIGHDWQCPAHDDGRPSLSVTAAKDKVLVHCQAGCSTEEVVSVLALSMPDLFEDNGRLGSATETASYDYVDEGGDLLFQVVRFYPKDFRQRRPDGTWKLNGVRRVPYRLPELIAAVGRGDTVYIVEGEKDVHAVERAGGVATTNSGGAGKWLPGFARYFEGAHSVVVVADADEIGRKHALQEAASLRGHVKEIRVVSPKTGKDASDHLADGFGLEDFVPLEVDQADPPRVDEEAPRVPLAVHDLADVLARVATAGEPKWLIDGLFPSDAYGVLGAEDKAGKTWAGLDLAVSVAAGVPWLDTFDCSQAPVLLFLGEGGERATIRRLEAMAASKNLKLADLPLRLCFAVPRLTDREQLHAVAGEFAAHPPGLVLLDPLYLAAAGAKGSDLYAMGEILGNLQRLVQGAGAALVVLAHWNKTGTGNGADRFSGVGPGAWGRVLGSAAVEQRVTDPDGASNVLLHWRFTGSEIADRSFRMRRRVRAESPELSSALTYEVLVTLDEGTEAAAGSTGLSPSRTRVLDALRLSGEMVSTAQIGDRIADDGRGFPLKHRTIQVSLQELEGLGLVEGTEAAAGVARYWTAGR